MVGENLKIGQSVWYRHNHVNEETHKMEREYGRGTVESITGEGRNRMAGISTEEGNIYSLKPYDIYNDEYEMKMDRIADRFEDKMTDFAEKYVNQCSNLIKGIGGSIMPQNASMVMDDVKLRIQMIGARLKDRFTEHTDQFIEETRELTLEDIQKGLDGKDAGREMEDDGGGLESANKKEEEITLTADDLKFVPQQETLKL